MSYLKVVILLFGVCVLAEGCGDIDETACKLLRNRDPDICQDDSIARRTCPKMCGTCRTQCLSCDDVDDPNNCTTTKECSANQECIITEHLSSDFHISYTMGCVDKTVCESLSHHGGFFGRRDTDSNVRLHYHCCSTDLCNNGTYMYVPTTPAYTVSSCHDRRSDCHTIEYSKCRMHGLYQWWARQNCAKHCGFCGKCYDKLSICSKFDYQHCIAYREYCPRHCGFCGCYDRIPSCNRYTYDVCASYKDWSRLNCPRFCGLCGSAIATKFSWTKTTSWPFFTTLPPFLSKGKK